MSAPRGASSHTPALPTSARVRGVCPVVETPFTASGEADAAALAALVDHLGSIGTPAVMYAGFASESLKLADDERDELTGLVVARAGAAGIIAVATVADHGTHAAVRRAERYADLGADLVNLVPPHQLAPSPSAVQTHLRTVIEAIAPTPVILQVVPAHLGAALDAPSIARLAEAAPNLVQVKVESQPPGRLITALRDAAPHLECLVGFAGVQLPDALRRGAVGVQPGCSATELYLEFWRRWSAGDLDEAVQLHARMLPYLASWMQDVELIVAAEKRISFLRGLIPTDACRAPGWTLDSEELAVIDRFLDEFAEELTGSGTRERTRS